MKRIALLLLLPLHSSLWAEQVCDTTTFPESAPVSRFQDNGDGTVTDETTQLTWMRCSAGQVWSEGTCNGAPDPRDWTSATAYADEVNRTGAFFFTDWRLPKLPELASLVERDCAGPRINLTVFPKTPSRTYWTTTRRPGTADEAGRYTLDFGADGVALQMEEKAHLVRLVRTGP
jgi:hypothetical protein